MSPRSKNREGVGKGRARRSKAERPAARRTEARPVKTRPFGARSAPAPFVVITCEHAGALVPSEYKGCVPPGLLRTHRAFDRGALSLATSLAAAIKAPLFVNPITRLLVDLNRSESNPQIWSRYSCETREEGAYASRLSVEQREMLLRSVYRPFRRAVLDVIRAEIRSRPVVHISVHSFTPVLRGTRRKASVGLLFDPDRPMELAVCRAWQSCLRGRRPRWRIDLNKPYRGVDDGHTTALRREFGDRYAGIEIEINQALLARGKSVELALHQSVISAFIDALDRVQPAG